MSTSRSPSPSPLASPGSHISPLQFDPAQQEPLTNELLSHPLPGPGSLTPDQQISPRGSSTRESSSAELEASSSVRGSNLSAGGKAPQEQVPSSSLLRLWKIIALSIMGATYLVFCYVCHYRLVKIPGSVNPTTEHLSIIKGGLTSISILYVSLSLLPLYFLISDLKGEEFFRLISTKHTGVSFNSVNSISTHSFGIRDNLNTLYRRNSTVYFSGAFIMGLVAIAVSTFAPAILSVGIVLFDGDLVALSVGAVYRGSILNMTDFVEPEIYGPPHGIADKRSQGGAVAWAESSLGVNYSFQSPTLGQTTYIVPTPLNLSTDTKARWISDVIAINPSCEWIAPDFISPATNLNFSDFRHDEIIVSKLTSKNIQVNLTSINFPSKDVLLEPLDSIWTKGTGGVNFTGVLRDLNTMNDVTNGAIALLYTKCLEGCRELLTGDRPLINDTGVHVSRLNTSDGKSFEVSFLYCDPKADVQTRHVTNDGKGFLSVGDKAATSQGNLNPIETSLLLSYVLFSLGESGPTNTVQGFSGTSVLGNQLQFAMVFGTPNNTDTLTQVPVQPINKITASYASILQSAVKPFLDGSLASSHVPARITREVVVFSSSLLHLISSTVLYALLTAFVVACHFRRPAAQFTLASVSSSLDGSNIPPVVAGLKCSEKAALGEEKKVLASLKDTRVLFDGEVLRIQD